MQLQKFNTAGNSALRKLTACSNEAVYTVFQAHCSYVECGYLLLEFNETSFRKLRVYHNDILRRLTGVPRWSSATTMFTIVCLDNLVVIWRKNVSQV